LTFLLWRVKLLLKPPLLHCRLSIRPCLPACLTNPTVAYVKAWSSYRYTLFLSPNSVCCVFHNEIPPDPGACFALLNWREGSEFGRVGAPGLGHYIKPLRTANTVFLPVKIPWRHCRSFCRRTCLSLSLGYSFSEELWQSMGGEVGECMECSLCSVWTPLLTHCRCRECYCCSWSHSMTHTQSVGRLWTRVRVVAETSTCTTHSVNNNRKSQQTSGRRPTP